MQNNVEPIEDKPSESEGLIKTPRQLIVTIILAFAIPIITILLLVKLVSVTSPMGAGTRAQSTDSIAERLQPVAGFRLVEATAEASDESRTGEQVYDLTCATCHAAGVADAPLFGNEAAWAPLIATGFDEMVRIAIEGVGAMPPRGGNPSLSDLEIARAVAYMANNAGGSFDEPTEDGAADASSDDAAAQEAPAAEEQAQEPAATGDAPASDAATDAPAAEEAPHADATAESEPEADAAADTDAPEQADEATDDAQQAAGDTAAAPDPAEVQQILTKNACLACHATENKLIGPSYRDVAAKYANEADAAETIAQHIKAGSSDIWGPIPMPPNPGISDDDLAKVVAWILAGAPQ